MDNELPRLPQNRPPMGEVSQDVKQRPLSVILFSQQVTTRDAYLRGIVHN